MKMDANDIRVGNLIEYEGKIWEVSKREHVKPGKGGAFVQVEMKDIQEGTKKNVRFKSNETIDKIRLDQKVFQYLYQNGDTIEVMDKETYEQRSINSSLLGDQLPFLQDGMDVIVEFNGDTPLLASLPDNAVLTIAECEPVVKGQTAASSYKPATLENGVRIMVPPFINNGDKVVVKIATQEYIERAK
jgi:elongation factor P